MCMHLTCACIFMCMTYICIKEHQPSNQRPVQAPAERVRRAHTWSFTSRAFTSGVIGSNSNMYGNSTVCHCVRLDRHNNNNNTITNSSSTTTHDEAYALAGPFTIDCANVASCGGGIRAATVTLESTTYTVYGQIRARCCCCCALYHLLRRFCVREAAACIYRPPHSATDCCHGFGSKRDTSAFSTVNKELLSARKPQEI